MESRTFLVQANKHSQQVITCSIEDSLLRNLPVSVVFFYKKSFNFNQLIDALKEVLNDFPIFAGILTADDNNLFINCNNNGVMFTVVNENSTLGEVLSILPKEKKKRLVDTIDSKKSRSNQSPITTIKLVNFSCGGATLGISWHHSIGDMHTFMCFMKAWSNSVNQKEYILPLVVEERDKYIQARLEKNTNIIPPSVRYLGKRELLRLVFYMLFRSKDKVSLQFYFSENELKSMKQKFLEMTNQQLSRNDVLCAHLFGIISNLDASKKKRYLSMAVNYRAKVGLSQDILGNLISTINLLTTQRVDCFELAQRIREAVDNFQNQNMDFFSTRKYIEDNGGIRKIDRFISKGIDPLKKSLLITNWSNFGVYDVIFGDSKPFYFTSFGDYPFPWLSSIVEGFSNHGLIYSVLLPSKLAAKLVQDDNIQKIHEYRDSEETMPELVRKLAWVL